MPDDLRDIRKPGWFWARNELIERDGKTLGAHGVAVYCVLAKIAGNKDHALPSVGTIAEKIGCSPNTARKAIDKLVELGWVRREARRHVSEDGEVHHLSNKYYLLDGGGTASPAVPTPGDEEGTAGDGVWVPQEMHSKKKQLKNKQEKKEIDPLEKTWQEALEALELELPRETFNTWLRDTRLEIRNGTYVIQFQGSHHSPDWAKKQLKKPVQRALERIAGGEVEVTFVGPS